MSNPLSASPNSSPTPSRRSIVLIGMMGSGKSAVGRRLAAKLGLPFVDSDAEIAAASGLTIPEFFAKFGEPAFREGERRVILRLLDGAPAVVSTGGGAFMDAVTREAVKRQATSIWLRVEIDLLAARVARRDDRPLLQGADPHSRLTGLLAERKPFYEQADIIVDCDNRPVDDTAETVFQALQAYSSGKLDI